MGVIIRIGRVAIFASVLTTLALSLSGCVAEHALAQPQNSLHQNSDAIAPALAKEGQYPVGVRTLTIVNPNQLNISTQQQGDRSLVLEVWYPAARTDNIKPVRYENETRSGKPFSLEGSAYRDAPLLQSEQKLPLVVISHGYTGYRTLMFYLGEHLASHGYIVAAIDHTDSTNAEVDVVNTPFAGFPSTLYYRSRDQQFTLDYLTDQNTFLAAQIDTENAGLIGYSMGGYGVVNTIGGCYQLSDATIASFIGLKDAQQVAALAKLYNSCAGGQYENVQVDKKWRAAVAIAPWGNQHDAFDPDAMAKINVPILYTAGEYDDVSDYDSIKRLFDATGGKHSYLLTYSSARHNIAAHPAPAVALDKEIDFGHYIEAAWSSERLNAINKHFVLAMMDCHIKQQVDACSYLQLEGDSNQQAVDGKKTAPWHGFVDRYSTGMRWSHK